MVGLNINSSTSILPGIELEVWRFYKTTLAFSTLIFVHTTAVSPSPPPSAAVRDGQSRFGHGGERDRARFVCGCVECEPIDDRGDQFRLGGGDQNRVGQFNHHHIVTRQVLR